MTIKNLHVGLCGPLPPPYGGMANQLNQLQQLLAAEGIFVSVVQTNAPYQPSWIENFKGIRALFRLILYLFRLWHLMAKVDVIHVFANSGWSWQLYAAPVLWLGWLQQTPVIINYRGGEARDYFQRSIQWIRPSLNKAGAIAVPSGFLKQVFADFGYDAQIIPNIINLERFTGRQPVNICSRKQHSLVITRNLEAIYGIATAIRALALLQPVYPGLTLTIAGSGPQLQELTALVKELGLTEHVIFTGKLTPDEIASLYKQVDIMLNPTTVDNMPNSILEAMASGIAIITSNVGGIPYLVEDNKTALFIDAGDTKAMAKQIQRLLTEPDLYETLVNNALQEVQRYTWKKIKILWLDLYQSVIMKKS